MPDVTYKTSTGILGSIQLTAGEYKLWRKFKRTLAIKEPFAKSKIDHFKGYLKSFGARIDT